MNKRTYTMLISLVVIFGGLVAYNVIKGVMIKHFFSTYEPPPVTVSSYVATKHKWYPTINAVGNFEAINGVEINTQVAGQIVQLHFHSGEFVQANTPLLDLNDSVEQATLEFNQADLALQALNYKRQTDLLKKGATPSSSVDGAHAKLEQSQANVNKTRALIDQKHIKAPFAGRLGIRKVNLGQYITPGQTEIATLQSMDPLYLKFHVPEQLLNKLNIHQHIIFSVEQSPNVVFRGEITAIDSKIDTKTHNIELQALIMNCPLAALASPEKSNLVKIEKGPLDSKPVVICDTTQNIQNRISEFNFVPGMFAFIQVEQPPIPDVILIPNTAISYSLYGNSVYVITKEKEKDKNDKNILTVHRTFIKTGEQQGNYTVIKSGIKPGQLIVSAGELKLQNGTRVVINNDVKLNTTLNPTKIGQ